MTSEPQPEDLDHSIPGWYLDLMAPRMEEKVQDYAWIDPSRIYMFPDALRDCTEDLVQQFEGVDIDLVIGIDAMGFILGTSIAVRLGKGMLTARKAGKICTPTVSQKYANYLTNGEERITMEMRANPFPKGTRVLIVDQWIETGGTMMGAIKMVEQQGGVVAGGAVIAIEETETTKALCSQYKMAHCIPPELQHQINRHCLDVFAKFPWAYK